MHGEGMSKINAQQGCPSRYHIDKLETYLEEINMYSSCLCNILVVVILYVDDVVVLSKS